MPLTIKENLLVGFSDFWSRKLRSFITIFGIILGTISTILILSLVNGMNKQTLEWMLKRGGLTKIIVRKNWQYENKKNIKNFLTFEDLETIVKKVKEIKYFSPNKSNYYKLEYKDNNTFAVTKAVLPDYTKIEEWNVQKGRFITEFDIKNKNSIVIIGTNIKKNLFGNKRAIGKYIIINNVKFKVVGIMQKKFLSATRNGKKVNSLNYMNNWCFIPLTTYFSKLENDNRFTNVEFKARNLQSTEIAKSKIEGIINGICGDKDVFWIRSMKENKENFEKNSATFHIIFYVISVISLLVGGIVIMNILLSTIKERTREIGIRIALGAKRIDIFMQFLIQTVLITFIGGFIGVVIALISLNKIAEFMEMKLVASVQTVVIALTISVGVGIIFGILPSIKASKLNPVEALRYE